jgi:hypothetical protein
VKNTTIKIIKRKDVPVAASGEAQISCELKQGDAFGEEKFERLLRRRMAGTISNWIAERRENRRSEEVSAFRKLFGDEFLSGRTA